MFRWTTCVRLDHLNAVGPPGSRNTVVQRNASGPTARKWSKRAGRVTTCETPSHHAGRAVGAERERRRRNRPRSTRSAPDDRPADPTAPDLPTHPEATRAGRHQRPSRSTSSKPPLNNLPPVREHHAPVGALRHRARFPLSQYYRVREYHAPDEVDVQLVAVVSGSTAQL